jgi:allantoicase
MSNIKTESNPFYHWVDLVQPRLGAQVVYANDDFFAAKERLIDAAEPVFIADKFDENGKWMDGWESRRRRVPGHDHCIIQLGAAGIIHGVDIDTSHFTGNYPPAASIEACASEDVIPADTAEWQEVVAKTDLAGDSHHYLAIDSDERHTHLRLNIYPDGGIARLRVYGEIQREWDRYDATQQLDLLAMTNGGRAVACNDEHYGSMHNLNAPGRGVNMGDGWETRRRREPGNDWVILALGHNGEIDSVEVDTAHFKGNYPDRASIQAACLSDPDITSIAMQSLSWDTLLPEVKLEMDARHEFREQIRSIGAINYVRLNIFPDGGVSRLRMFGRISR